MNEQRRPDDRPELTCVAWGQLRRDCDDHPDCPVRDGENVCTCECRTCKRAWWDAGRPATGRTEPSE